jgi:hypothetical protein
MGKAMTENVKLDATVEDKRNPISDALKRLIEKNGCLTTSPQSK